MKISTDRLHHDETAIDALRKLQGEEPAVSMLAKIRAMRAPGVFDPIEGKGNHMRAIFASLAVLAGLSMALPITPARADADDAAWIKKCVSDNKKEGASAEVVAAWCSCMNNKMSSNETLSITAWEKTHPAEVAACDKESGWK
jgi:hypothetical protein